MDINDYQQFAMRTASKGGTVDQLLAGALGLIGEAAEVSEHIKKFMFHGHELDPDLIADEVGDVLWYAALLADTIKIDLSTIALRNITKLQKRYPEGFSAERSVNRGE